MPVPSGVICLWPGLAADVGVGALAGWTRETALDARYIRGAPAAGDADLATDRGNTTHTHTSPAHTPTQPTHFHEVTALSFTPLERSMSAPTEAVSEIHSHALANSNASAATTQSFTITVDAASNDLAFIEAIFIKSDGTPVGIPVGAYAMFASDSLPSLWVRVHGDRFPKGAAAAGDGGGTGGANSHAHTTPNHTHIANAHQGSGTTGASSGLTDAIEAVDVADYATGAHTHTYNLIAKTQTINAQAITIASGDGQPTFKKLNVVRNDNAAADLPTSIIALWGGTHLDIPFGWTRFTSMDDKFLKGAAADGQSDVDTGGGTQHLHTATDCAPTVVTHNHSGLTNMASSSTTLATDVNSPGSGRRGAAANHVHTATIGFDTGGDNQHLPVAVTIDNSAAEASWPKHRHVIFIQFVGEIPAFTDRQWMSRRRDLRGRPAARLLRVQSGGELLEEVFEELEPAAGQLIHAVRRRDLRGRNLARFLRAEWGVEVEEEEVPPGPADLVHAVRRRDFRRVAWVRLATFQSFEISLEPEPEATVESFVHAMRRQMLRLDAARGWRFSPRWSEFIEFEPPPPPPPPPQRHSLGEYYRFFIFSNYGIRIPRPPGKG